MSTKTSTKKSYKNPLINDLVKNAGVLIVMHMLMNSRGGKSLLTEESLYTILSFLIGLIFYWTIIVNIIKPLN